MKQEGTEVQEMKRKEEEEMSEFNGVRQKYNVPTADII